MSETQKLQPSSLRDQALANLRARLISGDLKPGTVYSAAAMAQDLGVSSGPVREAMLTLVEQGMMEVVRNKGFRVVELTPQDRANIAEVRTLLEIPSMGKLANTPELIPASRFRALADEMVAAARKNDLVAYLDADRAFHLGLLALLENDRLTQAIGSLRDQTRQYGLHLLSERGELESSAKEHHAILDALLSGDTAAVVALMETHLRHLVSGWSAPGIEPR